MGMFDEIYCHAALPDGHDPRGTCFQTKSLSDPCMCRYRITSAGRLIDSAGNDLEPDGYITFYRSIGKTATAKRGEEFRGCASIALDFRPDNFKISCALKKTVWIASVTVWLPFDGSRRARFSSTIRMKSPTQVRLTLGLGHPQAMLSRSAPRTGNAENVSHFDLAPLLGKFENPKGKSGKLAENLLLAIDLNV
jgi:hypothetical protein